MTRSLKTRYLKLIKYLAPIALCLFTISTLSGDRLGKNQFYVRWEDDFNRLSEAGVQLQVNSDQTVSLYFPVSGVTKTKSVRDPDVNALQSWRRINGVPLLELDPSTIDTSKYSSMYKYWTTVPLSNGFGAPLIVGDLDYNGKPEVYGNYKDSVTDFLTRIYEVDSNGNVLFRSETTPRHGASQQITDVDKNGLNEVKFQLGDSSFFDEQSSPDSLPNNRKIAHAKYLSCSAIFTYEPTASMDGDSLIDFVYRGSDPDTFCTHYSTYVAEYDPASSNFKKVWQQQLWPPNGEAAIGGYDVGDYDADDRMNFLASGMDGQVWVMENDSDNHYYQSWKDSIPLVNLLYQTSGDVDGDGKTELFISATMSDGNWTVVYEMNGDTQYSPTFIFHLLSGGSLDEPTLLTTDVDGDGKPEFVLLSGADLFIFKSNQDNQYTLWYYKRFEAKDSIQFYDFDSDGKMDYILSKSRLTNHGALIFDADIYKADIITSVEAGTKEPLPRILTLSQNYPNPFNPSTVIRYQLHGAGFISLSIFNLLGDEVSTLVEGNKPAGEYSVTWDANKCASGMYICRLMSGTEIRTMKLLLVK